MPLVDLTADQIRAFHDLAAYTLRPRRLDDDPDVRVLREGMHRLRRCLPEVFCLDCGKAAIHALNRCQTCYRRHKRSA